MQRDTEKLKTMLAATERIMNKTDGIDYDTFCKDSDVLDICAMQCQIIGNMADSVSIDLQEKHSEIEWSDIYGLRYAVAHAYGSVSFSTVKLWNAVKDDIPTLAENLKTIIRELEIDVADDSMGQDSNFDS